MRGADAVRTEIANCWNASQPEVCGPDYVSRFILRDTHQKAMPARDTRIPKTPITNTAV